MNTQDLTPREAYIFSILLEVRHDSIWGRVITDFQRMPTVVMLRALIKQLGEAAHDNPYTMRGIIGRELTEILLQPVAEVTEVS